MAEAFARTYGSDVVEPSSAGLYPAIAIAPLTWKVLRDRGIDISTHFPKSIVDAPGSPWDIIVNISGQPLPRHLLATKAREWKVADPIGQPEEQFLAAANQIESLVMSLIIELRGARSR
jgi:arsenate reductase